MTPLTVAVPDDVLDDLTRRLAATRLSPRPTQVDGEIDGRPEADEPMDRIDELIRYWRDGYDWRAQERRLNAAPAYRATVDGVGLHVVHVPGTGPDPLPLLLLNGWPSSIVEYLGVLGPLTDPARYGGDPADSFSVVAPALPGYGFSDRCLDRPVSRVSIAALFNQLMLQLGYPRYVAHGDDIGGGVVNRLGMGHRDTVLALQTANPISPYLAEGEPLTDAERSFVAASEVWESERGAYSHLQGTRPWTLAAGLNDSPAGLASWILQMWLTWSDPATRPGLTADDLLSTVMIYWVTQTIGSSVRLYLPATAVPLGPEDRIDVPTSVLLPNEPYLPIPPASWLRRAYPRLERVATVERGGHFLALENPGRFVEEIRAAFRPHR